MSRDEWNSHLEMFIVSVVSGIIGLIGANYLYKKMSYSEVKKVGIGIVLLLLVVALVVRFVV